MMSGDQDASIASGAEPAPPSSSGTRGAAALGPAPTFFDQPFYRLETLDPLAAGDLIDDPVAGTRIGPYRIARELGHGGSATVYLAIRADGAFQKQVAIKLIKRGMDTDALMARLRRERRILAALDHPGIARLLDAGTTARGRPWFVMEYIEGQTLLRYCEQNQSPLELRCELIAAVSNAVSYAHRYLVVHRDLKPANILVDAQGKPRLLDFGVAKLLTRGEPAATGDIPTGASAPAYTPEYASPEQHAGGLIGTASDIYSLGVVAFELLSGVRPANANELPSQAALRAGSGKLAARRLRGDLDTILLRALHTQPERRYPSVDEFGADLRRHLSGLPVHARRETVAYRAGKFIGRHRQGVAAAVVVSLAAGAGAALYVRQARLADRRFADLRQLAHAYLFEVDAQLLTMPDSTAARGVIVKTAFAYLNSLALQKRGDPALQRETANAWRQLGDVQGDPLHSSLGDTAGARVSYQHSVAMLEPLAALERGPRAAGDARGDLVESYRQLAALERVAGNNARAQQWIERALPLAQPPAGSRDPTLNAAMGKLEVDDTWVLEALGRYADGERQATAAVTELTIAVAGNAEYRDDLAAAYSALGGCESGLGQSTAALAEYRRNLELRRQLADASPNDPAAARGLLLAWAHVGDIFKDGLHRETYSPPAAVDAYQKAYEIARQLVRRDPTDKTARLDEATALERLADVLTENKQTDAALVQYRASLASFHALAAKDPHNREVLENIGYDSGRIGLVTYNLGKMAEARAAQEESVAAYGTVIARDPANTIQDSNYLSRQGQLARTLGALGDRDGVNSLARAMESAAAKLRPLATTERHKSAIPAAWAALGDAYARLNDVDNARAWYQRSLQEWQALQPLSPSYAAQPPTVQSRLDKLGPY